MNWKMKSLIQRTCARVPGGTALYYGMQLTAGQLRQPDFLPRLQNQRKMLEFLRKHQISVVGAEMLELGTGWVPVIPVAFWIAGARVHTFDLNRYLSLRLTGKLLHWIAGRRMWLVDFWNGFVPAAQIHQKIDLIERLKDQPAKFLAEAGICYVAPGDAARTDLPDHSIDIHFSSNVFEHIPGNALVAILREARRVLKPEGVAIHHVDPTDHFSHGDRRITGINFLQFEDPEFAIYNNNQFAYHNRLRDGDFRRLIEAAGFALRESQYEIDRRSLAAIHHGLPLAPPFKDRDPEELCRYSLDYLARPASTETNERRMPLQ